MTGRFGVSLPCLMLLAALGGCGATADRHAAHQPVVTG